MESKVKSLKDHKQVVKSKVYIGHIEEILKVTDLTINALNHFKVYKSVANIINDIKEERAILVSQLVKLKKFIKEKESDEA